MGCPQDVSWQTKSTLLAMGRRDKLFHFVRKENVRQNSGDNSNLALPQVSGLLLCWFGQPINLFCFGMQKISFSHLFYFLRLEAHVYTCNPILTLTNLQYKILSKFT